MATASGVQRLRQRAALTLFVGEGLKFTPGVTLSL
jgi:hypothetical protein